MIPAYAGKMDIRASNSTIIIDLIKLTITIYVKSEIFCITTQKKLDCNILLFFLQQEHCGSVNDKYIEYELTLVAIDIILHRKPAFRHLLHNRQQFESIAVRKTLHGERLQILSLCLSF